MPPKTRMTPEQVAQELEEKEVEVRNPTPKERLPYEERRNREIIPTKKDDDER